MNQLLAIADKALHPKLPTFPSFQAGDTIKVYLKVQEKGKDRIKTFEGTVIKRRGNTMANKTFTVRKISHGISVVRTFPLLLPSIDKIEVRRHGKVRRSNLSYLLSRKGHAAKVKERMIYKGSKKSKTK